MTPEERQQLIAQYAAGYDEVAKSLEGFTSEELTARPIQGKWSACEIVQHLADSEMNSALRLRRLLYEDRPVIQGYDQDGYATRFKYNERDFAPALDAFRGARATSVQILSQVTEEDWKREGWHSESGLYTLETWLKIYAAHAHNHAAQIRRLKEVLNS
ncbi:MAG TPA: DinB family protein [Pyrinomonadaceae bacterium]